MEEPRIMATIKQLFFKSNEEQLLCSFGSDTYTLWKDISEYQKNGYEVDVFNVVKERLHKRGDYSLDKYYSHQIESIYLFFDYDPQNRTISSDKLNQAIGEMLDMFSDSMDNGQIYISYPMVESIYCENTPQDTDYISYCVSVNECRTKEWCNVYSYARKRNNVIFKTKDNLVIENFAEERILELKDIWVNLIKLNAVKANFITNGIKELPKSVSDVDQMKIFDAQLQKFIDSKNVVSILSSFTLFLFEYFHGNSEF